ncbi:hypothetical protein TNCV_5136631 [Trichonephila clavipes]|nr:hypothetical protein TNCV_5136631 [Trichonephila clavipes]
MSIEVTKYDKGCWQLINQVVKVLLVDNSIWWQVKTADCDKVRGVILTATACNEVRSGRALEGISRDVKIHTPPDTEDPPCLSAHNHTDVSLL